MNDNSFHISNLVRGISRAAILSGLLAVVLGVVMLAWPQPSIVAAAVLLGVYLVVSGVALVFLAFSLPASAGSRFLTFISGVASVALGILAFRHFGEGYAILLLAIWVATGFIIRGVFVTASAIGVPGFPGRGWAIVFGFISIIAGFVMLAYPFDSIETLALVVGACLIILGEVEVGTGVGMRRDVKKAENSVMSADWPVRAAPTITDKSIALQ
jgi:uncharacterized membrane protein HdeD (DUF308 family)